MEGIMAKKPSKFAKNINLQIPEAQQTLSRINTNKCTPRHSMLKWLKAKGKILKAVGEK